MTPRPTRSARTLVVLGCALLIALLGACSQTLPPTAAPNAVVSGGGSVPFGTLVLLDASGSSGDDLDFAWSFEAVPAGATPLLSSSGTAATSFTPDRSGTYVVRIEVSNAGGSDSATITVGVEPIDLAGNWTVTITFDASDISHPMTLIQDGTDLSGMFGPTSNSSEIFPIDGGIEGDEATFGIVDDGGSSPVTYTFRAIAEADGDVMEGTLDVSYSSSSLAATFVAVRVP